MGLVGRVGWLEGYKHGLPVLRKSLKKDVHHG